MAEKRKNLVIDDRSLQQRLSLILPAALFAAATVCLFAPYEYQLTNYNEFWFSFQSVWWCFALIFLVAFVLLCIIGLFVRGKLLDIYVTLLVAVTFALYIEGNFVHVDYGVLTGEEIRWERFGAYSFLNTGLWIAMLGIPFVVLYFSKKIWNGMIRFLTIGIVLVEFVTLVTVVATNPACVHSSAKGLGFSWEGTGELSKTENTLVILLDECDVAYLNEQRMRDEHSTDFPFIRIPLAYTT